MDRDKAFYLMERFLPRIDLFKICEEILGDEEIGFDDFFHLLFQEGPKACKTSSRRRKPLLPSRLLHPQFLFLRALDLMHDAICRETFMGDGRGNQNEALTRLRDTIELLKREKGNSRRISVAGRLLDGFKAKKFRHQPA